jgi:Ca-activated chloride channel family protein
LLYRKNSLKEALRRLARNETDIGHTMAKRYLFFFPIVIAFFFIGGSVTVAQDDVANIRVNVDLVQLNVAVTDNRGNYVSGLGPENFAISEDKIPERISTFEEGNEPARQLVQTPPEAAGGKLAVPNSKSPKAKPSATPPVVATEVADKGHSSVGGEDPATLPARITGANVFVLFDTSNYMYRGFVFAQDAIADFVRSLEGANKVAFYSYSRDLSRNSILTSDRAQVLRGVRSTVAGDDAALYNCLLLTVEDAARLTGRKVIVVFSNGPDNASLVPPEDVAELAQSTGTIIYMISTREAELEPISTAVFERMSKATGGKAYFARSWSDEKKAFAFIQEDLAHLYSLSYYPQPNPSTGWRAINVKLVGKDLQKYHVRTRAGYRLQQAHAAANNSAELQPEGVTK